MRNLDNYEQLFDNDKNFLHGKLVFCQKGTTTQEPVFAWDSEHDAYVSVTPIVYTDVNGRPNVQIYLADKDYTIYVYKYIGNGDMTLDSDDDNWTFQYSFNNLYNVFGLDIKSNAVSLIDSMASLKATDPTDIPSVGGEKLVALGGYNAMGDCPVVYYKWWASASTASANDVDVVSVAGIATGCWLLVNTFEETGIFDVRHAGCFPKDSESDVEVTQSYALKKADTYASKFGLTLFVPSIFENDFSYYIGTNVSIYSKIWFDDGAKIVTATSLVLNDLSERNAGRNYPFILHSDTNNGSINVAGDLIHTSWFENTETANPSVNYPPSINCRKKFVYDGSLGVLGSVPEFTLFNMDVEILSLLENETFDLTNCKIVCEEKIKRGCKFTECEIKGTFFYSGAMYTDNSFTDCTSDIDTWSNTDWYVTYCEKNGVELLDLKYRECTIDFGSRATFPFKFIRNAHFSDSIKIPSGTLLNIWDSQIDDIVIDADNATMETIRIRNSVVTFKNTGTYKLSNCLLDTEGSEINVDGIGTPIFKSAKINNCTINGNVKVSATNAELFVTNCLITENVIADCTASFKIVFDDNVLRNLANLVLTSSSLGIRLTTSSFCNNVIQESGEREFIDFSGVAGFDVDDIGTYRYENNSGVSKFEDSASFHCRVKYRKYGNTDTGNYVLQTASSGNDCILVGDSFRLSKFFFSFGEKTKSQICVKVELGYLDDALFFKNDKSLATGKGETRSATIIYENGIDANTQILHGEFGSTTKDYIQVPNSYADGVTLDFVLNIKKVERIG